MSSLTSNERDAIRKLKDVLTRDFGLVEMKLIGSKARGDSDPESDIDLVVVLRGYDWKTQMDVYGVCFEIGLEHDVLLSPVIYSIPEFNSDLTRITPFYQSIQREAVAL